jgi:hypothetical protein
MYSYNLRFFIPRLLDDWIDKLCKKIYSAHLHGATIVFSSARASAVIKIIDNEAVIGVDSGATFVDCPIANRYAGLMHGIETA